MKHKLVVASIGLSWEVPQAGVRHQAHIHSGPHSRHHSASGSGGPNPLQPPGPVTATLCYAPLRNISSAVLGSSISILTISPPFQHPNIVNIYGVSVLPPSVCILLELCAFGSLADVVKGQSISLRPIDSADKDKDREGSRRSVSSECL